VRSTTQRFLSKRKLTAYTERAFLQLVRLFKHPLTEIFDLSDVKVISHRLHTGIGMILQIEQEKSFSTCPKCGTTSHKLHQNHRHIIKDLPFGEKEVFLEINRRQFKCGQCKKPFSEDLDFVKKKRTYTKRLARKTIQEVLEFA
jgi:transposase